MSVMSIEQMLKGLHKPNSSKSLECNSKFTAPNENGHVSPTEDEYVWKPHVYNGFPKAQRIRKPATSSKRSRSSTEISQSPLVVINKGRLLDTDRTIHLSMPCVDFNHGTELRINSRRKNCSFVTDNKVNMKKKGLDLNNLYSLKQSKRGTSGWKIPPEKLNAHMSKSVSANININNKNHLEKCNAQMTKCVSASLNTTFSKSPNKTAMPYDISSVLQFDGSSKSFTDSPMYGRLIRGLEREAKIPGHVCADDTAGNHLGKVLTKTHLENLLTEEEPVIPPTFYITS